ncbi:MAG: Gfo/Idh/MocA family oxidoreductase [Terracoccus sp.]
MNGLRFAAIGAGFWANFQLHGWQSTLGTECVAICDRERSKAEVLAAKFGIAAVYDDAEEMLRKERIDFIDVISGVDTHAKIVKMAASLGIAVVCQKPMASSLEEAEQMVRACRKAGVPLLINENWRWQTPIRRLKEILSTEKIGHPFRARISMMSGFPVFDNQPSLRNLEHFILTDLGSHILDVARFLFGEPRRLYCQTHKIHQDIRGEDVATVLIETQQNTTVLAELAYAGNHLERDRFPETCVFIEGETGSLELTHDFVIRVTSRDGTHISRIPPPTYSWADPAYAIVHSSIVPCQANLLASLQGTGKAETDGDDNLKTVRMVYASYESAQSGKSISFEDL